MTKSNNGHKSSRVPRKTPVAVKDKNFPNMLRIQFEDGGVVPASMSGMYNNKADAQKAIDDWVIGYSRPKIQPTAPKNDIPQRIPPTPKVETNGEEQSIS